MAGLVTLCGSMLGFICAATGFFVFDIGFLAAFAVWVLSGPVSAMLALTLSFGALAFGANAERDGANHARSNTSGHGEAA